MPRLGVAAATPGVRGASSGRSGAGTVWRSGTGVARSLLVCVSAHPPGMRWLAGSLAVRLPAVVLVSTPGDPDDLSTHAAALCRAHDIDQALTAVIGDGDAAEAAIAATRVLATARLALISPPALPHIAPAGLPTTLIQASASGPHRVGIVALDDAMRRAGVAVRETEYQGIADGWARYPRAVRGSGRALDDLVAFLERGIGESSTFDVIPGWDLH